MSEIKPALTAGEWAGVSLLRKRTYNNGPMINGIALMVLESEAPQLNRPQAMAALCLHEQPFGFTRWDVIALRAMQDRINFEALDRGIPSVKDLADRIEALLPPVDDKG
jgi:hypothetical protein